MTGGSSAVYSVLRNTREPAGSWGGDCARMKRPPPQGGTAGQQPLAGSKHTVALATWRPEGRTCLLPYPGVCGVEVVRSRDVEMVRSDLGAVSRKGGRSVVGGFPCPLLPFPSPPYATDGKERPEALVEMRELVVRRAAVCSGGRGRRCPLQL